MIEQKNRTKSNKWLHIQKNIWKKRKWKHIKRFLKCNTTNRNQKYRSYNRCKLGKRTKNNKLGILDIEAKLDEKILTDKMEIHFIQIPKFRKERKNIDTELGKWMSFIAQSRIP